MKIVIGVLALVALSVIAAPASPVWPVKFTIDFEEDFNYPIVGTVSTTGSFWYDAASGRYRVDRVNGRGDRYCGINGFKIFQNTPCSHYVTPAGDRFIYYPEKNECCYCCSAEHGCGILRRDWLSGAEFQGETTYKGVRAYKWDKPGLQSNLYFETIAENPDDRIMLNMNQKPNDDQQFYPVTWSRFFQDSILDLPSICKKSNSCAIGSTCTAARHV